MDLSPPESSESKRRRARVPGKESVVLRGFKVSNPPGWETMRVAAVCLDLVRFVARRAETGPRRGEDLVRAGFFDATTTESILIAAQLPSARKGLLDLLHRLDPPPSGPGQAERDILRSRLQTLGPTLDDDSALKCLAIARKLQGLRDVKPEPTATTKRPRIRHPPPPPPPRDQNGKRPKAEAPPPKKKPRSAIADLIMGKRA